jgi:hypothetical protein
MPRADLKSFPESVAFRHELWTASERDINDDRVKYGTVVL